jgi:hypothetical protein
MMLRRAPIFLRIVVGIDGTVDGLDRLDDTPELGEKVHVYRRVAFSGSMHVRYTGRHKPASGLYPIAEYEHLPEVDGDQLRDTDAWRAWAQAQEVPA